MLWLLSSWTSSIRKRLLKGTSSHIPATLHVMGCYQFMCLRFWRGNSHDSSNAPSFGSLAFLKAHRTNSLNQDPETTWMIPRLGGWYHRPLGVSPLIFLIPMLLSNFMMALQAPRLGGCASMNNRRNVYGSPNSQARGLDTAKLVDADSCQDWRPEKLLHRVPRLLDP